MPRGKSYRRCQAARRRMVERQPLNVDNAPPVTPERRGTGYRHAVQEWPISALTGRRHKLVLPAESPAGNKFVLVVGDSHLRSLVDGFVKMPEGRLSFGFMSTPGASAAELRTELLNGTVTPTPDLVCLLAPSNNLTASRTFGEAGVDFAKLLRSACNLFPEVVVLDFPPRLTADADHQKLMREEFHRVAYLSTAEHFPLDCPGIWSRDGVHLSDSLGIPILSQLFWHAAYVQLEATAPTEAVPPRVSPRTSLPRFCPRIVVKGEVIVPRRSNPFEWTVVGRGKKVMGFIFLKHHGHRRTISEIEIFCSIPLNPVWFSSAVMDAMDAVVPSHLSSPVKSSDVKRSKVILLQSVFFV
uniref:Uncharacterized protein n=1 Tax=Scophthalmus maximus TaxID=52904 RepID=A0A8D3CZP6_SCOMX